MAWTAPRTWVASEVVTEAHFDTHISDNETVLALAIDPTGKIRSLLTAHLADQSGTNLTGLPLPGGNNDYTGKGDFSAATFIVPVGVDQFVDDGGTKRAGSIWVEGDYLHYIDSTNSEWRYLGTFVSAPVGATIGSLWCDTAGDTSAIRYIDADGDERFILSSVSAHSDGAAVGGSLWAETVDDYLHYIRSSGTLEYIAHADTHTDGASHSDRSHTNTHTDTHGDITHTDWDSPHTDTHTDHEDSFHEDEHGDNAASHGDIAHTNTYTDEHGNVSHNDHDDYSDVAHDDRPLEIGV